jgi:hypothetical protein
MIKTARLFYKFWDTGNAEYASAAVDNDFRDNTLPAGRPQGTSWSSSLQERARC